MKKIRIKFCGYDGDDENFRENFIYKILVKFYEVEISENPDYVFYNESSREYLKYDCIRIFYTGENYSPNFNFCDYAVGFDLMSFADRYYRLPLYLMTIFYNKSELKLLGNTDYTKPGLFAKQDLLKKTEFCSFVYSNYLAEGVRRIMFEKLSAYKKVNAGGRYLNNISHRVENKLEFESKHKFSIAFENSSRAGYTTEKIACSLAAKTIPIYWGNPEIGREFNEKRFINCHRYASFDQVVERVKEIDKNDDLFLSIVNEPVLAENYNFHDMYNGFEEFLKHIMDQPVGSAGRRSINPTKALELERNERMIARYTKRRAVIRSILAKLYQPFKRVKVLEKLKIKYFVRNKTKPPKV